MINNPTPMTTAASGVDKGTQELTDQERGSGLSSKIEHTNEIVYQLEKTLGITEPGEAVPQAGSLLEEMLMKVDYINKRLGKTLEELMRL